MGGVESSQKEYETKMRKIHRAEEKEMKLKAKQLIENFFKSTE